MLKIKNTYQILKILNFGMLICILIFGFCTFCLAQDKIIAIVNNDIITQKDLDDFVNFMRMQLAQQYKGKELENRIQAIKLDLIDRLIEDRLILQEAKNAKISVEPNRLKGRLEEIKRQYRSEREFQDSLAKQGLVEGDLEQKIKEQMLMYIVIQMKVKDKIVVNPNEVTDFYNKNKDEFKTPEQREFESISSTDRSRAQEILLKLKSGASISDLAKQYSAKTNKLVAGKGELRKEIEKAIFSLKPNEISQPLEIEREYYIFRLDNIIQPKQQMLVEVGDIVHRFIFEKKMQEGLARWLDEVRKNSYIKIM